MSKIADFQIRKSQHIDLAMRKENQSLGLSGFDCINLPHNALPEIDFSEVSLEANILGQALKTPFFISAMTAGNNRGLELNKTIAKVCNRFGWMFGLGSQRRQLFDNSKEVYGELAAIRNLAPDINILSNIGLSQLITLDVDTIKNLLDSVQSSILVIHTNPLQEAIQPEGTPNFKGGLRAVERVKNDLGISVVLKETGCGISKKTARQLSDAGVDVVDVSGLGGTHWGRIEGMRANDGSAIRTSETFKNWGIPTTESIKNTLGHGYEVWASGGVRSGLDGLKSIYLGAKAVGFAKPALENVINGGEEGLIKWFKTIEREFKVGMFCMGKKFVNEVGGIIEEI